jgi:hypothetical protein
LALNFGDEPSAERLKLTFASALEGRRWYGELQTRHEQISGEAAPGDRAVPEGVSLVRQTPDVPYVSLGRVEFTDRTRRRADRGLQLRAGMRGADAVIGVERRKFTESGQSARHASGLAIRVEDAAGRRQLRQRWYSEEIAGMVNRVLLLLVLQAAVLLVAAVFWAGASSLHAATGETLPEALMTAGMGFGILYAWPLLVLVLLRVLRWPQLLRTLGLAVLAVTTARGLTVLVAHLLAARNTGAAPDREQTLDAGRSYRLGAHNRGRVPVCSDVASARRRG